jgi:MarR family transcriptional regulator, organic hydroperoxide resistance regulator
MPLAEDTNTVSIHGLTVEDVKITHRALLAVIENLARDEWPESTAGKARRKATASRGLLGAEDAGKNCCGMSPIRP